MKKTDKNTSSDESTQSSDIYEYDTNHTHDSEEDFHDPWDKDNSNNNNISNKKQKSDMDRNQRIDTKLFDSKSRPETPVMKQNSNVRNFDNFETTIMKDIDSIKKDNSFQVSDEEFERKKKIMKEFFIENKCALISVGNSIFGFVTGSFLGLAHGFYLNRQDYGKLGFRRALFSSTINSGASFGFWLGSYSYSKCQLHDYRRKSDIYNTFSAGCIAGSLTYLAGSIIPRIPRPFSGAQFVFQGLVSGVLMTIFDSAKEY